MYTQKQIREIKRLSEVEAKQTHFYKKLVKRTYRRTKGYIDYKQVALDFATHLMCLETGIELRQFSDPAWNAMTHSAWMAYENPFPVFGITRELTEAFLATDLPPHVCGLNRSFNNALFLLPEVLRTPDNFLCQWAFVSHFLKGEKVSASFLKNLNPQVFRQIEQIDTSPFQVSKLRWVSQVGKLATTYSSLLDLPEEGEPIPGEIIFGGDVELWGASTDQEIEQQFTRTVDRVLLQALLYLQHKASEFNNLAINRDRNSSNKGFSCDPHRPLEPIWIGKDYKPKVVGVRQGSHASPRLHWRRGHWKRVVCGEGRSDRRWQWIEPTLVNAT